MPLALARRRYRCLRALRSFDDWKGRDRYVTMFGQAYADYGGSGGVGAATIANGGVRIMPHIVKSWTNADGTVEVPEGTPAAGPGGRLPAAADHDGVRRRR